MSACSGSDAGSPPGDATGGADTAGGSSTGGATGTAGAPSAGGSKAIGGSGNTGGTVGTGGATSTGGAIATGGANNTGGSKSTGGSLGTGGGASTGGKSSGGAPSTGGTVATGGSKATGGAVTTGGTATTGGSKATGGFAPTGGSQATGGFAPTGGSKATGGVAPTGGSKATGGATASGGGCSVAPVDPSATPQAKNLLCYLYSQYKNHVLSGQQETSWSNPANDISFYTGNSSIGKAPAVLGGDYLYPSGTSSRAIAYWNAGGITMIRYHAGAPPNSDTYENSMLGFTSTQCNNVINPSTSEGASWVTKMNYIATEVGSLQSANVPVLLALFHETQSGGWFWWSKCSGSQFIALYNYTYNYLVNTKGLHNIVRLMPFSGSPNSGFYPGKAQVDVTGGDTYGTNPPFTSLYSSCAGIGGTTIPLALHETGVIPQPSTMFPTAAPWVLWNIWAGYESSNNTIANIISAYADAHTITRDEIPSLK